MFLIIKLLEYTSNRMRKRRSQSSAQQVIFMSPQSEKKIEMMAERDRAKSKLQTTKYAEPSQQLNLHMRMKEKFEELYKKIKKISHQNPEENKGKMERRYMIAPNEEISMRKPIHYLEGIKSQLNKIKSKSIWDDISVEKKVEYEQRSLQINTVPSLPKKQHSQIQDIQIKMMKATRYNKPKLSPIKRGNMSNNIRDYLSVEKIKLKDIEYSISQNVDTLYSKSKELYKETQLESNLIKLKPNKTMKQIQPFTTRYERKPQQKRKFVIPFETYYYRDLLWRVGYTHEEIVQTPPQYEQKIRVFIGRGNNSRLIKSIINRRSWMQVTEKIDEALIIWTQLKIKYIYSQQKEKKAQLPSLQNRGKENPYIQNSIWSTNEDKPFKIYFSSFSGAEQKMNQQFKFRNKNMKVKLKEVEKIKIQNHLPNNFIIGNKKALFKTMSQFYKSMGENVFEYLPLTFHICDGIQDEQYLKFLQNFYAISKNNRQDQADNTSTGQKFNAWIVKPGENTNRGQGITVCMNLQSIKAILKNKQKHSDGTAKTYILQKYIEKPLLYRRRKFDIRNFIMVNCANGMMKGYWFKDGYARTCSSEYTLKANSGNIHLTNDAVQKQLPDYGKFEKGNKINYDDVHDYLQRLNGRFSFWQQVYPKMKKIATDVIRASAYNLDPQRHQNNFQIFGLDFMLDEHLNVWLIEVNTNPCLEISCPLLSKIIPPLIEQTLELTIDPYYPPPVTFNAKSPTLKCNSLEELRYELVYDERWQAVSNSGAELLEDEKLMKEEEDLFDDDGEEVDI